MIFTKSISTSLKFGLVFASCFTAMIVGAQPQEQTDQKSIAKSVVRDRSTIHDGVWSGYGNRISGTCYQSPTMKFMVKQGRIFMDGFTHGAFFGSGSSKLYGVIHLDRTVDVTLVDRGVNGRTSQAHGDINERGEMILTDLSRCTHEYKLKKG